MKYTNNVCCIALTAQAAIRVGVEEGAKQNTLLI